MWLPILSLLSLPACALEVESPHSAVEEALKEKDGTKCDTPGVWDGSYQHVELYDGSLGVSRDFVAAHESPVVGLGGLEQPYCSATLVGRNVLLTAGHCLGRTEGLGRFHRIRSDGAEIWAGRDPETGEHRILAPTGWLDFQVTGNPPHTLREHETIVITELLEHGDDSASGIDYALARVLGNPGDRHGFNWAKGDRTSLPDVTSITVIGHPSRCDEPLPLGEVVSSGVQVETTTDHRPVTTTAEELLRGGWLGGSATTSSGFSGAGLLDQSGFLRAVVHSGLPGPTPRAANPTRGGTKGSHIAGWLLGAPTMQRYVFGHQPLLADVRQAEGMEAVVYDPGTGRFDARALDSSQSPVVESLVINARTRRAIPFAGDFNGDGHDDVAIFEPAPPTGAPYVSIRSWDLEWLREEWLVEEHRGNLPVVGDFDGDGADDIAFFDPWTQEWKGYSLRREAVIFRQVFGTLGGTPLAADVDGDRIDDLIFHNEVFEYVDPNPPWQTLRSRWSAITTDGGVLFEDLEFGAVGDEPLVGDVDGDGRTELLMWRHTWDVQPPGTEVVAGGWLIYKIEGGTSSTSTDVSVKGNVPLVGNTHGKHVGDELVVWSPGRGTWSVEAGLGSDILVRAIDFGEPHP